MSRRRYLHGDALPIPRLIGYRAPTGTPLLAPACIKNLRPLATNSGTETGRRSIRCECARRKVFESPYTDHAPTGPDYYFADSDVDVIVGTLRQIRETAVPTAVA